MYNDIDDDDVDINNIVDLKQIEDEIDQQRFKKNSKVAQLLNVSKQYKNKQKVLHQNNMNDNNNDGNDQYYSDEDSSMYYSSESDIMNAERAPSNVDNNEVESGIGNIPWGKRVTTYYGADTEHPKKENDETWKQLREEEAIGIRMQNDKLEFARPTDFLDLEIAEVVKNYSDEKKHDKKVNKSAKKVDKNTKNHGNKNDKNEKTKSNIVKNDNNQKIDDDSNTNVEISEENNNDVKDMNMDINDYSIEVINKDVSTLKENEQLKIIKRDNPELIGIIEELGKNNIGIRTCK